MPCGASLEIGWIPVRKTVKRDEDVGESDHVEVAVRILPILEQEQLDEILRQELEAHGWTRQADGSMTKSFGEALATLPAGGDTVRLESQSTRSISASATVETRVREEDLEGQAAVGDKAAQEAEARLAKARAAARAALVQQNIDQLVAVQEELQTELADVTTGATKRALETRAGQLGAIESMVESRGENGGYELTIKVKT
jgi:hypothetical protein